MTVTRVLLVAYRQRIVEGELARKLEAVGAVLIEGAKGCGKTATASQVARSAVYLDVDEASRDLVELNATAVLAGECPRLLDEWQLAPKIWNAMRHEVDRRDGRPGQFILTGSARPADDVTRHTGAARVGRLRMRPMTLAETGHSDGRASLGAILRGELPAPDVAPALDFPGVLDRIALGGWPGMQGLTLAQGLLAMRDMAQELVRADVKALVGKRARVMKILSLCTAVSRHVATNVSSMTLAHDLGITGSQPSSVRVTVDRYLAALEQLMIMEDLPGWAPHLRSRSRLRTAPKRHFVDPALAVAYLGATPDNLRRDLESTGFLFESLVIRDLRVYAQANDAAVSYYRDNTGLEVDAVVQQAGGRWAGFEVKLGSAAGIADAVKNLLTFRERIDTKRSGAPALLGIIVSQGPILRRDDGISIIPVGALGQ